VCLNRKKNQEEEEEEEKKRGVIISHHSLNANRYKYAYACINVLVLGFYYIILLDK
jgi:hypothetical protein